MSTRVALSTTWIGAAIWLALSACSFDDEYGIPLPVDPNDPMSPPVDPNNPMNPAVESPNPPIEPLGPSHLNYGVAVSGAVIDFATGGVIGGTAEIATSGLSLGPAVSVMGGSFTISRVPPASTFYVLAASAPEHRATYNLPVTVESRDVGGVRLQTVAEAYIERLATVFEVSPDARRGIVIARVVDAASETKADVSTDAFNMRDNGNATRPYFLDASLLPDRDLEATSASGYVVFFDVQPGTVVFEEARNSRFVIQPARAPTAANTVTLIELVVTREREGD